MNPYVNQVNQSNAILQNVYPNFIPAVMPSMANNSQKIMEEGFTNQGSQQLYFEQQNNSFPLTTNMLATPQPIYRQQIPFQSADNNPYTVSSASINSSPQQGQVSSMLQQQWAAMYGSQQSLGVFNLQEQEKQQFMMLQQSQPQSSVNQQAFDPMSTSILQDGNMNFSMSKTGLDSNKIDIILLLNTEIIRLLIESQKTRVNLEPNLSVYQAMLQSNLTYLAAMADAALAKTGDVVIPPPDFSSLPLPSSKFGEKIHELNTIAQTLFEQKQSQQQNSNMPVQQQLFRQQAAVMRQQPQQQQFLRNPASRSGSISSNASTPNTPIHSSSSRHSFSSNTADSMMLRQNQNSLRQQQLCSPSFNNANFVAMNSDVFNIDQQQNMRNIVVGASVVQQQQEIVPTGDFYNEWYSNNPTY